MGHTGLRHCDFLVNNFTGPFSNVWIVACSFIKELLAIFPSVRKVLRQMQIVSCSEDKIKQAVKGNATHIRDMRNKEVRGETSMKYAIQFFSVKCDKC
jgi:hypothetical protein